MTIARAHCVVIGIGNPDRGDDAIGRVVARRLCETLPSDIRVVEHDGEATSLLACMDGAAAAFLIDACVSATAAGTVRRFDVTKAPLPQGTFNLSTHGFGLAEAVELARVLGQLPPRCVVYAVEAASVEAGESLSPEVAAAIADVGARIQKELLGATAPGGQVDA